MARDRGPDMRAAIVAAAIALGGVIAQLVAAKSTRDALFLGSFAVELLPRAMASAAVASLLAAFGFSRAMARWSPARVMPVVLAVNAVLYGFERTLFDHSRNAAAISLYLHVAVFGTTLIAGLWSLVNESFDPHTAKRQVGKITMGGALGGVLGGIAGYVLGGRSGVPAMLGLLSILNLACIPGVIMIARRGAQAQPAPERAGGQSGFRVLREIRYLRELALLVMVVSVVSALLDYVLSVEVVKVVPRGPDLVAFFALFHTGIGLLAFLLQAFATRPALERLGLAGTLALLPGSVLLTAGFGMLLPGLATAIAMRGMDALMSSSLYRSAYELLYTPVPRAQKRPAKMLIDVGLDRVGTALGSGLVMLLVAFTAHAQSLLIGFASVGTAIALASAFRLHRGYISALASSLKSGAVKLRDTDLLDATTKRTLAETTSLDRKKLLAEIAGSLPPEPPESLPERESHDEILPEADDAGFGGAPLSLRFGMQSPAPRALSPNRFTEALEDLRSDDAQRVRERLLDPNLPLELGSFVIGLLARDDVSRDALHALRRFGVHMPGQLVDALLDRDQDPVVRRRIPRVLETIDDPRAAEGLVFGLFEPEFDVRHQSAWALQRLTESSASIELPRARIFDAVKDELERGRRALGRDDREALRSVEQGIVVLSLVLEREPLGLAYRALLGGDENLRGTALEYFENVLPDEVRSAGLPLFDALAPRGRQKRQARELRDELLRTRSI